MITKRFRLVLTCILVGFILWSFVASFSVPRVGYKTEFSSSKLQLQREFDLNSNWKTYGLNFQPNKLARLPEESTVRQQLSFQFPYEMSKPLPKVIWQTWKIGIENERFPKKYQLYQETWSVNNPDYKHYILADEQAHEMIANLYETVPDVVDAYNSMPKSILKADFFRYLILFARGGVYSDIDTVNIKPIDQWLSANETLYNKPNNPGLVVGIESDPDRPDWHDWYARRIQFCQWTIQAKKGHPMLRELIAHITDLTLTRKKKGTLKKVLGKDQGGDIMEWTGPGIWTDYVFKYFNNILQPHENFNSKRYEEIITWKVFTGIEVPIVIDDVMVLPITSFSPGVGHMGSKSVDDPLAYSQHIFSGSWKNDKERSP